MICELPVVASKVGGIPEIIDENCGILVESKKPQEIAKALLILIEHSEIRKRLGKNGNKRVLEEFTARKVATAYEKVYMQI